MIKIKTTFLHSRNT